MLYTSPLDPMGVGGGGCGMYASPNAAAMAAAASAIGVSTASLGVDCGVQPHLRASNTFFGTTHDVLKNMDNNANNNDMKNVVQQSQLANIMQNMTNFHQFQASANISNAFNLSSNNYGSHCSSANTSPNSIGPTKKKSRPVPQEQKNSNYYERRKKNNDSARRSRELRRQKEEENERRRIFLEQENQKLTFQLQHTYNLLSQYQLLLQQQQQPNAVQQHQSAYNFS